jgi:hypothetical protein
MLGGRQRSSPQKGARKTTTEQSCNGAMPTEQTSTRKRQQAAYPRNTGLLIRWGAQEIRHPGFEKRLETLCLNREKIIKDNKICPFAFCTRQGRFATPKSTKQGQTYATSPKSGHILWVHDILVSPSKPRSEEPEKEETGIVNVALGDDGWRTRKIPGLPWRPSRITKVRRQCCFSRRNGDQRRRRL